jgi:hypothetical protein
MLWVILLLMVLAPFTVTAQTLTNPSFESGTAPWKQWSDTWGSAFAVHNTFTTTSSTAVVGSIPDGANVARITYEGDHKIIQDVAGASTWAADSLHTFMVYYFLVSDNPTSDRCHFAGHYLPVTTGYNSMDAAFGNTATWTPLMVTVPADTGATTFRILFRCGQKEIGYNGTCYIDDFKEVTSPEIEALVDYNFGWQEVAAGATSAQIIEFTNTAETVLIVTGIGLVDGTNYLITNAPEVPLYLNQGDTATVSVVFDPAGEVGWYATTDTLRITSSDADEPNLDILLNGTTVPVGLSSIAIQ